MKLNKLRLLGFKSFVEPTDFHIEHGLTGVVGPNGCGKSNLVEALRWVMGETSHKSLRAAGMDDVIFSGTNTRPARNTAEVMLFLDNADRSAPAQFNEHETLEVSRRIEREKGSLYRLNGREVRARDVQLLFADASTGARSPALVHQGRIGEIIQAKPEQRRRVLEEAAGVAGLHARRHEAELRLKAAETNLDAARRRDRAAGAADRCAEASGAPGGASTSKCRPTCARPRRRCSICAGSRRNAEVAEAEPRQGCEHPPRRRGDRRAGRSRHPSGERGRRPAAAARRRGQSRRRAAAPRDRARAARPRGSARQRAHRWSSIAGSRSSSQDIAREQRQQADAEAALERLASEEAGLAQDGAGVAEREAEVAARVSAAETALAAIEKTFSELTGALADLVARRNQLERAVSEHSVRLMRLEGADRRGRERACRPRQAGEWRAGCRRTRERRPRPRRARWTQAEAAALRAEAAHSGARQALDVARGPLGEADRRVEPARSRGEGARQADRRGGKEAVAARDRPAHGRQGLRGGARRGARRRSRSAGRSGFADPLGRRRGRWRSGAPGGRRAARAATCTAPPELARRLAQIGVVDRALGPTLVAQLKPGQRLVSPEGDLWRWDGFAAASNAPTAAARRLAAKNRLADLDARAWPRAQRCGRQAPRVEAAEAELDRRGRGRRRSAQCAARGAGPGRRGARCACGGRARGEPPHRAAFGAGGSQGSPRVEPRRDDRGQARRHAGDRAARLGRRSGKSARRDRAARSRRSARCWRKRAAKRRRSRARPSCAPGASPRSRPSAPNGTRRKVGAAGQVATLGERSTATRRPSAARSKARRRRSPSSAAR